MFLLDDVLLGPGKAALMVFKELARKVEEDWLDDDAVKLELQEIYALVEAGKISSQEFEARECKLLERLEQIARARFNDKWGPAGAQQPVIEGEVAAELPAMETPASARTEMHASYGEATPWQVDTPPVIATPPVTKTPWLLDTSTVSEPPAPPPAPPPVVPARTVTPVAPMAPIPVAPMAPMAPVAPLAPSLAAPSAAPLSISQVFECTARALALLNLKVSVITSVAPDEGGWRVTAELVERRGIPDTNDLIGVYELRLDAAGTVLRYERTRLRRRGDLGH
jgi:hypothetical protein